MAESHSLEHCWHWQSIVLTAAEKAKWRRQKKPSDGDHVLPEYVTFGRPRSWRQTPSAGLRRPPSRNSRRRGTGKPGSQCRLEDAFRMRVGHLVLSRPELCYRAHTPSIAFRRLPPRRDVVKSGWSLRYIPALKRTGKETLVDWGPRHTCHTWRVWYSSLAVVWPETFFFFFLFCPLYVFIHFSAAFCTAHCALDLARDHAPQKCPSLLLLLLQ